MTHPTLTVPRDRGVILAAIQSLLGRVLEDRRIRRDIARLESMSDHLLRDIGLTRSTIRAAVRTGVSGSSTVP